MWIDDWTGQGDWLEGIVILKEQGKIRHFGVSVNDHEADNVNKLIATGVVDTIQLIYNIFDQTPETALLPLCLKHNVGTIIRVP